MAVKISGLTKDPETAVGLATLLQFLDHFDPAADLTSELTLSWGQPATVSYNAPTATVPAWAVCYSADHLLVLVGGVASLDQAGLCGRGYLIPRLGVAVPDRFRNGFFDDVAALIWTYLQTLPMQLKLPTIFAGHSAGGCVCLTLAETMVRLPADVSKLQCCSFGSPKWGWTQQVQILTHVPTIRWANDNDPVPLFPPTSADYLTLLLQFTPTQVVGVNRLTVPAGGLVLTGAGTIYGASYPPLTGVQWSVTFGSWLWQWLNNALTNPHSLAEYISRLNGYIASQIPASQAPRPATAVPAPLDTNRANLTREQATVQRLLIQRETDQRSKRVVIPAQLRFQRRREGRTWVISYLGNPVAVCTRRRTAISLTRALNETCRHLLTQGLVDPQAMQDSFDQFLSASEDTSSGISPLLSTDLEGPVV